MTKFVKVKEADLPTELSAEEFVIPAPNFITEILACKNKAPRSGHTSPNYMMEIAAAVADRYLTEDFNTLTHMNVSRYRGIDIVSPEQMNDVVTKMMLKSVPDVLDAYVDYHIKQRPDGVKLIYFLGDHLHTTKFTVNGIDELKQKEIDSFLGTRKKKILSKSDD